MSNVPNNVIVNEDVANLVTVNQDAPNNVIVVEDTANRVIVNQDAPNQVAVRIGVPLSTSVITRRFVFSQDSPSAAWAIEHPLGGRPSITVVDSSGTVVIGEVTYISDTQIMVEFTAPFSGFAYLT